MPLRSLLDSGDFLRQLKISDLKRAKNSQVDL